MTHSSRNSEYRGCRKLTTHLSAARQQDFQVFSSRVPNATPVRLKGVPTRLAANLAVTSPSPWLCAIVCGLAHKSSKTLCFNAILFLKSVEPSHW